MKYLTLEEHAKHIAINIKLSKQSVRIRIVSTVKEGHKYFIVEKYNASSGLINKIRLLDIVEEYCKTTDFKVAYEYATTILKSSQKYTMEIA